MDDPFSQVKGALEAATAFENTSTKTLSFLERRGWLPVSKKRERNMLNVRQIELNLEAMEHRHRLRLRLDDALAEAKAGIISQSAMLAVEQLKQLGDKAMSEEDKMEILDTASRAATRVYKQAMDEQYALECISLRALKEAAENPDEKASTEEPSETWMNRFMKYGSDARDEDIIALWGKVLAGEIKKPGSFSLRTLDILHGLDRRDAETFTQLAPYVINDKYVPKKAVEKLGLGDYRIADLASTGLVINSLIKVYEDRIVASNRSFVLNERPQAHCSRAMPYNLSAIFLTEAGSEIYRIIPLTTEESRLGLEFLRDCICEKDKIDLTIAPLFQE